MQQARMSHAYCVGLNPSRKKMRFHLALKKTFLKIEKQISIPF